MKYSFARMLEFYSFLLIFFEMNTSMINPLKEMKIGEEFFIRNNNSAGNEDLIRGIINSQNRIVLGGSICSFIGQKCKILIQIFDLNFQIIQQKFFIGISDSSPCNQFQQMSNGDYLIGINAKINNFVFLTLNKIDPNLIKMDIIAYENSPRFSINQYSYINTVEIFYSSNIYRTYFTVDLDPNNILPIDQVRSIDIKIDPFSFIQLNDKEKTILDNCSPDRFLSLLEIGNSNYYTCGRCVNSNSYQKAYLNKYNNGILDNSFIYDNLGNNGNAISECRRITFNESGFISLNIFYNGMIKYLSIDINDFTTLSKDIQISFPYPDYYFYMSIGFVSFGSKTFSMACSPNNDASRNLFLTFCHDNIFYTFDMKDDNSNILSPTQTFSYFDFIQCPKSICYRSQPVDIYKMSNSLILLNAFTMYETDNWDYSGFIIDPYNPSLTNSRVFGGSGNYLTSKIIDDNRGNYIIYGNDGNGLYFIDLNKETFQLYNENKFRLEYPIIDANVLLLENKKLIVLGNYIDYQRNLFVFLAELDNYLYGTRIPSQDWMKNIQINIAINKGFNHFSIAGYYISGTNKEDFECYYSEINYDYSQYGNPIRQSIPGEGCIVNSLISTSQKGITGVGYTSKSQKGVLISFKLNVFFHKIPNKKNIILTSVIQTSFNRFIAAGMLNDLSQPCPYYLIFDNGLNSILDTSMPQFFPSSTSNLLLLSDSIFASANTCSLAACLQFILFEPFLKMIKLTLIESANQKTYWSLARPKSNIIFAAGSKQDISVANIRNSLDTARIKIKSDCPPFYFLNIFDLKCYLNCTLLSLNGNFKCMKYNDSICLDCQIEKDNICNEDLFNIPNIFCKKKSSYDYRNSHY